MGSDGGVGGGPLRLIAHCILTNSIVTSFRFL